MVSVQVLVVNQVFEKSNIVKELNESFNVKVNVVRGQPQPNGQVEVVVRTLKERINARLSMHSDFFFIILLFSNIFYYGKICMLILRACNLIVGA